MRTVGSKNLFTDSAQVMPANPATSRTYPIPQTHQGT
jgi:hypothetical protein